MTEADSTTTTGGVATPNLSLLAMQHLAVIRERVEDLDRLRTALAVVLRPVRIALGDKHADLSDALRAIEQAQEAPLQDILDELSALAPNGAA